MLALYRTLSFRYLRQRWQRAVLVIASIAIGVATLVATRALNQSMEAAGKEATTPLAGLADLHVSNGEAGVRRDLADEVRRVPGVRAVEPVVIGRVRLPDLTTHRHALLLGLVWRADSAENNPWGVQIDWEMPAGVPLREQGVGAEHALAVLRQIGIRPALVGSDLAAELKEKRPPGTPLFRVQSVGQDAYNLTRAGVIRAAGPAAQVARNLLLVDAADAADMLRQPGLFSRLDLFLQPGADPESVRADVQAVLGERARVQTSEAHGKSMAEVMAGVQVGFALCGAGALVVGLFLVYNSLAVSVAERRHDIGIMRSLGATRAQVAALFAGEAVLLGLVGSVLGLPLGKLLAQTALGPVTKVLSEVLIPMEARQVHLSTGTLLAAVAAGIAVSLLAALVPALQAASDEPADAVRRVPSRRGWVYRFAQVGSSAGLIAVGAVAVLLRPHLPGRLGLYGGLVLFLLGLLLATPLFAALLMRALQPVVRRLVSIEARLAADNLVRAPGRTGLVIAALAAGVTMMVQTMGVSRSNEEPIYEWIERSVTADLFVSFGDPITAGGQNLPLEDEVGKRMKKQPEVAHVLPIRFRRPSFRHTVVLVVALDAGVYHAVNQGKRDVPGLDLYRRLGAEPGTAIVSDNFAALHNVEPGDSISLDGPHGPVPLQVIGTVTDYSWSRGVVFLDRSTYRRQFRDNLVDAFDVYLKAGADGEAVQRWCEQEALFVMNRTALKTYIIGIVQRLYGIAFVQQVVMAVVATLGVITALMISVLQRRRELGLLRAVGATRGQVLRSVIAEATLMGAVGTVIGMLVGIPLEWYVLHFVIWEESGYLFPLRIPWIEAGVIALLAVATATLAGLGPALSAVRLRIAEAIAYE